jgi:hypothetical protein
MTTTERDWPTTQKWSAYARAANAKANVLAGYLKQASASTHVLEGRVTPAELETMVRVNDRLNTLLEIAGLGRSADAISRSLAESINFIEQRG